MPGPYAQPTAVPQHNAMTLLSLMLANPNLQRTLQTAHVTGVPPRSVDLPVPASTAPVRTRQVHIPLGAVINALSDARKPRGVHDIDMPATPARVWETITRAKATAARAG